MATLKESLKNPAYPFGSATILLYFASWGIWWSFFQIWLTSDAGGLRLTGAQVGQVYATNGAFSMGLMLLYGTIQDRLFLKRTLMIVVSLIMSLVGPFVVFVYGPLLASNCQLGTLVGGLVLSAGFIGSTGLFEAFVERLSRRHGFEFGQARMWGSFGYAIVALCAGFLFTINPMFNFWVGSLLGVVLLLIQLFWRQAPQVDHGADVETPASTPGLSEMLGLLKDLNVWVVILFVLLSWTFYTVFDQQMFPDFYTTMFPTPAAGQQAYGILNSVQVFCEALMMGVVPIVMRKVGVRNTLLLGALVMFIRILGCATLHGPVLISLVKMLHAIEVPLFVLSIFKYFSIHFNPALSATLYLVAFNLASQVGNVVLSSPLGQLRDNIAYQPTFYVIAGVVLVSVLVALALLKRDNVHVIGEPFVRDGQAA